MKLQEVKKVLFSRKGRIIISIHTMQRLEQRGYTKGDIVTAILNGEIVERQSISKVAVLGRDTDDNPVVVVIAKVSNQQFKIVTTMPPIDRSRFRYCI
ncbi:DUF4258 domain-containing protein [Niallia sp. HCP3S3_B10]|uniref:DUF4258 domain-containing protein n=1 Tax=Niallia sp. HCP3S3_B10 TaxID=3438944 RepID=UPI003F8ACD0E